MSEIELSRKEPDNGLETYESPLELKTKFVELRAQGYSYRAIAKELKISVNTLRAWERELAAEISELKAEELDELFTKYAMAKEARIKGLGEILERMNAELGRRDLSELSTDKLLDFKIKYAQELKEEYTQLPAGYDTNTKVTGEEILGLLVNLLGRLRSGEVTREQAQREGFILSGLLKAYEATKLEHKVEALEAVIKGRG